MGLAEDIAQITRQEAELVLDAFDTDVAWRLGTIIRELAIAHGHAIVIDIRRFGQPSQQLFYTALAGRRLTTIAGWHGRRTPSRGSIAAPMPWG